MPIHSNSMSAAGCDAERVEKFFDDASKLCAEGKPAKIAAEIQRLRSWLTKHQDEMLVDSGKQKLIACAELYFKFAERVDTSFESPCGEAAASLVSDLLKLPEGKLIRNQGGKSKALKWLAVTQMRGGGSASSSVVSGKETASTWSVLDVTHQGRLYVRSAVDDTRDDVVVADASLLERIRACVEAGGQVRVELDSSAAIMQTHFEDADD